VFHDELLHHEQLQVRVGPSGTADRKGVVRAASITTDGLKGMQRVDERQAARSLDAAVHFIASQPGGVDRILAEHRPDARGLCRGCTTPGTGQPHLSWPCSVAKLAQAAARVSVLD